MTTFSLTDGDRVVKVSREHLVDMVISEIAGKSRDAVEQMSDDDLAHFVTSAAQLSATTTTKSASVAGKDVQMSNEASEFVMATGAAFEKSAIADRLDSLAKARARETGEDYAKAYDGVLETTAGAELYAGYRRAPEGVAAAAAEPPKPPVTKAVAISDALDALAKQRAQQTGETVAAAYLKVLDSEVGRVAYGEMRRSA